jgi:hypothetical protein
MSGKYPRLNPLASRKQLLIAESELNRVQLVQEWHAMADEARSLAYQARTLRSFASAAATLVAGLTSCRQKTAPPAAEKPSWGQTILKVTGLFSTFWSEFRSSRRRM